VTSSTVGEPSREWLDQQYNVRAGIPDHEDIFARWAADSAALRAGAPGQVIESVGYGPHPAQAFDVYLPECAGAAAPVLVFVHGGYWQSLDKDMFGFLARAYTSRGICFVALNYRLAPEVGMDDIIADVADGFAAVATRASGFGADPDRLYLAGHSAGGHLVTMLMVQRWADRGLPADLIKGVCAISGLYDLEPIRRCYLNAKLGMTPEVARGASPVTHKPAQPSPLIVTYGGAEPGEFDRQQSELVRLWTALGVPCQVVPQPDGHHFDAVERLSLDGPLRDAMLSMILPSE
jgi:arylformamidase